MISEATTFIAACYGSKVEGDIVTNLEAIAHRQTAVPKLSYFDKYVFTVRIPPSV